MCKRSCSGYEGLVIFPDLLRHLNPSQLPLDTDGVAHLEPARGKFDDIDNETGIGRGDDSALRSVPALQSP